MPGTVTSAARERARHLGPERRRPQILDAARAIAVRDGIGAVTVVSIAHELGVTRPVIYAAFNDRVELIEALLDREAAALLATIIDALHSSGVNSDPEDAFVTGFQALLAAAAAQPDPWLLLLAGEPDPQLSQRFKQTRAHVSDQATAWIGPAMTRWWNTEGLDRKLPVLIEFFMSSCESAIRSLLAPGSTWDAENLGAFIGSAVHRAFKDA